MSKLASQQFEEGEEFEAGGLLARPTERYHVEYQPASNPNQAWARVANTTRKTVRQAKVALQNALKKWPRNEYRIIRTVTIQEKITF